MTTINNQPSPMENLRAFALAYGAGVLSTALVAVMLMIVGNNSSDF